MYYTSSVDLYLILTELKIIWVRVRVRRDENAMKMQKLEICLTGLILTTGLLFEL